MTRVTIYLSNELHVQLKRVAAERKCSMSAVVCEGIRLALAQAKSQAELQVEPPRPHFGIFSSGDPNLSQRVDELLEVFGED